MSAKWNPNSISLHFLYIKNYLLSQTSPPGGATEERIQLHLRTLIQFTVSLGEIIIALKPVSALQRSSDTKTQLCLSNIYPEIL